MLILAICGGAYLLHKIWSNEEAGGVLVMGKLQGFGKYPGYHVKKIVI